MKVLWSWLSDHWQQPSEAVVEIECLNAMQEVSPPHSTLTGERKKFSELSPREAAQEVASLLTFAGSETTLEDAHPWAGSFFVARIESVQAHPSADHLKVCQVRTKQGLHQIVCGAPNARLGLHSILALPGCHIPQSQSVLQTSTLRGVQSEGMLCSGGELLLQHIWPQDGIIELSEDASLEDTLWHLLPKDYILRLEVTPNRSDLLSHLGVARELEALGFGHLRQPTDQKPLTIAQQSIPIHSSGCQQIYFCEMLNPRIPQHDLMRNRLLALERRLHSPMVDLTNYIAEDIGQPLHAFDADICGTPIVRESYDQETFQALDGQKYTLPAGLNVIADEEGILALAGVMGGQRGSVHEGSTRFILESASFSASSIARAGRLSGIHSQARYRFERGVYYDSALYGLQRALNLAQSEVNAIKHSAQCQPQTKIIDFPIAQVKALSGVEKALGGVPMTSEIIQQRLKALGASCEKKSEEILEVTPPAWRLDWHDDADCVEEILRVKGYAEIPCKPMPEQSKDAKKNPSPMSGFVDGVRPYHYPWIWEMRRALVSRGFCETLSYSFISSQQDDLFGAKGLRLANPISQEFSVLRRHLLPSLIEIYHYHRNHQLAFDPIFEIAPCFYGPGQFEQHTIISMLIPEEKPLNWQSAPKTLSFFDVKSLIEQSLHDLGMGHFYWRTAKNSPAWYHPGQCAELWVKTKEGDKILGHMGYLHPRLSLPLFGAELDLSNIGPQLGRSFYEPPALQAITKDLSFFIPAHKERDIGSLIQCLQEAADPPSHDSDKLDHLPSLESVKLSDCFQDQQQLSVTLQCTFQPREKSFSGAEIHHCLSVLVDRAQSWGAVLRGSLEVE